MESAKRILDRIIEWVCVVLLAVMTILVTFQVVVRYFFNSPNAYTESLSKYMFVWMVMYGSAYVFGLRALSVTICLQRQEWLLKCWVN